jgi:hypothetical protein
MLPFLSHEKIRVCDIMWKTIKIPKETCVMYKKGMFLLLVSFIFFSLSTNVSASVDDYIRGYAEAVLEREFGIHPDSLTVNGGVITVGFQNMENVDQERIISELSGIRGVQRVEFMSPGKQDYKPLIVSHKEQKLPGEKESFSEWVTPRMRDRLFEPLIADPRWPHFSLAYHYYIEDEELKMPSLILMPNQWISLTQTTGLESLFRIATSPSPRYSDSSTRVLTSEMNSS